MKPLSQYATQELTLVQPSFWKRVHHLRAGDEVLMTMTFPKWYSHDAVVEGFGETVEFTRPSIWKRTLEIKNKHQQLPFAKFVPEGWNGSGMFELPNGGRVEYRFGLWKNLNELYSQQKVKLASLTRSSIFKTAITVTIDHGSELLDRNPWLLMAVYRMVLERRQGANGAG